MTETQASPQIYTRLGDSPLVLSMPHSGTHIPPDIDENLNARGREQTDCDWRVEALYAPLADALDASVVMTPFSRYVIDVNRDPSGVSLYPGQATTGLVPETDFDGAPLWRTDITSDDIEDRKSKYFNPYHGHLQATIERVQARHGFAVLYDCHSIRSRVPRLFDGELPVLNLGTYGGRSCAPEIEAAARQVVEAAPFSHVVNGRFQGGWITRHYGDPDNHVHAVQMELAQSAYLAEEAPPWMLDPAKADRLRQTLGAVLRAIVHAAQGLSHAR